MLVFPHVREALFSRVVDNDDLLGQIRVPVLITHGIDDEVVFLEAAQQHARLIPHATTSFYAEVGHLPFWEHPHRFNRELRAFARSCLPT
jgi:non-heme chloroperoxidase